MKRRRVLLCLTVCFSALSNGASAQHLRNQERVVSSGESQKIDWQFYIDPTCHSMGAGSIGLIDPPKLGSITVRQGEEYPSFSSYNARSRCNTRKVPATQLIYSTPPGTVGDDSFTVEYIGPLGRPRRERFHIVVR